MLILEKQTQHNGLTGTEAGLLRSAVVRLVGSGGLPGVPDAGGGPFQPWVGFAADDFQRSGGSNKVLIFMDSKVLLLLRNLLVIFIRPFVLVLKIKLDHLPQT